MIKQYQLTKKIHAIIPKLAEKYNKEVELTSSGYYLAKYPALGKDGKIYSKYERLSEFQGRSTYRLEEFPEIVSSQIRQILIAFEDVLTGKPKVKNELDFFELHIGDCIREFFLYEKVKEGITNQIELAVRDLHKEFVGKSNPESFVQAFCQKWLDGLTPLFDKEPETVLEELLEILTKLLNQ